MGHKGKRNRVLRTFLIISVLVLMLAVFIIMVDHYYPLMYTDIIFKYSGEYDLNPELVSAVIHAESRFNKDAVSPRGASGLMQIMEDTAYWLADDMGLSGFSYAKIFEPELNIRMGCYYIKKLERQYGDIETALCAYNAGSSNVNKWLKNPDYSSDGKTLEYIPFLETRDYIERISKRRVIYKTLHEITNLKEDFKTVY